MIEKINDLLGAGGEENIRKAIICCRENQLFKFGTLLHKMNPDTKNEDVFKELLEAECKHETMKTDDATNIDDKKIRVFLCGDWCNSKQLCDSFNKQSKGDYCWDNIRIVWDEPADYYVIMNKPPETMNKLTPTGELASKTILFRMEPYMERNPGHWHIWCNPQKNNLLFAGFHELEYNNIEWHLAKSYNNLMIEEIKKERDILSSIVSSKYYDPGHRKRVDFLKYIDSKMNVDIYGSNIFNWNHYKGQLPSHCKDDGLLPYKYTFNVENNDIKNYLTEKIVDGILTECLTFYHGCPNISDYIDENAYVWLDLDDFESDYQKMKSMIENDEWSKRIDVIRKEKKKILNELQFFPRLKKIIEERDQLKKV